MDKAKIAAFYWIRIVRLVKYDAKKRISTVLEKLEHCLKQAGTIGFLVHFRAFLEARITPWSGCQLRFRILALNECGLLPTFSILLTFEDYHFLENNTLYWIIVLHSKF